MLGHETGTPLECSILLTSLNTGIWRDNRNKLILMKARSRPANIQNVFFGKSDRAFSTLKGKYFYHKERISVKSIVNVSNSKNRVRFELWFTKKWTDDVLSGDFGVFLEMREKTYQMSDD